MAGKPGMTGPNMGGRREGAGRPFRWFRASVGDEFVMARKAGDASHPLETWRVAEVGPGRMVLACGDETIILLRS